MMKSVCWTIVGLCLLLPSVLSYRPGDPFYNKEKIQTVASWASLDFAFPSVQARQESIQHGDFIPGSATPIDFEIIKTLGGTKMFVSLPRFQEGTPATLGYFMYQNSNSPVILPYPNWEMNRLGNCQGITSVFRIRIDECGRLWVLDTGRLGAQRICPPQLLIFNPKTDEILRRYRFPESQLTNSSLLINLIVDIRDPQGQCKDTFVYISDVQGFQIIVYDYANHRSWNIRNNLFYPYPPFGTITINGLSFDLMDGIFTGALSPIKNGDRILYFHSLASNVESYVSTSILRNYYLFKDNPNAAAREFKSFAKTRIAQAASEAMDKNGVLFYGLVPEVAIGCWNSRDYPEYGGDNLEVLIADKNTLQFASSMKIISSPSGKDELWMITMSLQKVWTGTINPKETNFRILAASTDELVRGTKCDVTSYRVKPHGSWPY
ncbi:hypothetical protein HCN44_011278 [Aphidius gifuensis]|uniref:Bee-milk protein n=2 Tax=Aphidius gifuensis TaxID=684658 RepID=A0A835CSJ0_APHGI|nr:protein yellow-like isoform X2 [Aphidius gifuensis]XP_044006496.1 protein yellow-like isoform X2 [Aphidius gifuensis]XP_044006497.1 protein yellow-like isoform X2 [Aphidius gifuensis]XP_044006498.1 protein yellow-like isoform X2 [Aphidius gifuensis]KAF7994009.1 hypothetical protein HCN44_011278 [Aphidius gifuensis]